jgi:hypothetical protein
VQNRFLAANDQGMPGVVTALESNYGRCTVCEQVNNFSLALVTPLGADDHYVLTHS